MKKTLLLTTALLCAIAQGVWAQTPVTFTEYSWDDTNKKLVKERKTQNAIEIEGQDDEWVTLGEKGKTTWYYIFSSVSHKLFNIIGEVHLILTGAPEVRLKHIKLEAKNDAKLHIHNEWGTEAGEIIVQNNYVTSTTYVTGDPPKINYHRYFDNTAAIGGGKGENMGSLFIHVLIKTITLQPLAAVRMALLPQTTKL